MLFRLRIWWWIDLTHWFPFQDLNVYWILINCLVKKELNLLKTPWAVGKPVSERLCGAAPTFTVTSNCDCHTSAWWSSLAGMTLTEETVLKTDRLVQRLLTLKRQVGLIEGENDSHSDGTFITYVLLFIRCGHRLDAPYKARRFWCFTVLLWHCKPSRRWKRAWPPDWALQETRGLAEEGQS